MIHLHVWQMQLQQVQHIEYFLFEQMDKQGVGRKNTRRICFLEKLVFVAVIPELIRRAMDWQYMEPVNCQQLHYIQLYIWQATEKKYTLNQNQLYPNV